MLYKKSENSSIACQTAGPNKLNISVGTLNYPKGNEEILPFFQN